MAQYYVYKQGTDKFRNGIRGGYYVTDIVLTALGFNGAEDTDWKCIDKVLISSGPNGYEALKDKDGNVIKDSSGEIIYAKI